MPLVDGLHRRPGLSATENVAVQQLVARGAAHDATVLNFHLDPPDPAYPEVVQQVLYYAGGQLVGFIGLAGRRTIEVCGLVDPDHRRRGIGRQLCAAAVAELGRRGFSAGLLVCDEATPTGPAFARALGGTLDFAEHRLRLDRARVPTLASSPIMLRLATVADAPVMAAISAAAFRDVESDVLRWISEDLPVETRRWFQATLDGEPIGNLRVIEEEEGVYITAFGVAPTKQGHGYGRHILLQVLAMLIAEGRQAIMIEAETDNRNALSLYTACGFVPEHTYSYYQLKAEK